MSCPVTTRLCAVKPLFFAFLRLCSVLEVMVLNHDYYFIYRHFLQQATFEVILYSA